jgi:uncharacterized membrane protein YfcA
VVGPYLVGLGLSNATVVATGVAMVTVTDVLKLATYWWIGFLDGPVVAASLLATPALGFGSWLGIRLNRWIPRRLFGSVMIAIAVAGSLRLLLAG